MKNTAIKVAIFPLLLVLVSLFAVGLVAGFLSFAFVRPFQIGIDCADEAFVKFHEWLKSL